ncbi:helix-turn-helix domain-containing protein [Micromonospora tarensis]|uniref:Helix-turn-helix domain-containing protein n=1 Tax=Micromonospora tarensis TaxID=2806100 RepID=A0ABS1YI14_9ACTN|nr:helix-turn-helix domain-containing protein [Micromonospora tarensis]MBM0277067.1 helix-turn-helix domain-containing protein [Micromonospora tarensis]
MSDHHQVLDPATAESPATYMALLRRFRERSRLTYRQIEQRTASTSQRLPSSTLHAALARNTLPPEKLVVAFLVATGADDREVFRWVDARRALLLAQQGSGERVVSNPEAEASPNGTDVLSPPTLVRPRRRVLTIGVVAVAATVVVILGMARLSGRDGSEPPRSPQPETTGDAGPDLPGNGFYRIRSAHSGHCLSERPGAESRDVYQTDCGQIFVDRALDRIDGRYLIRTFHPRRKAPVAWVSRTPARQSVASSPTTSAPSPMRRNSHWSRSPHRCPASESGPLTPVFVSACWARPAESGRRSDRRSVTWLLPVRSSASNRPCSRRANRLEGQGLEWAAVANAASRYRAALACPGRSSLVRDMFRLSGTVIACSRSVVDQPGWLRTAFTVRCRSTGARVMPPTRMAPPSKEGTYMSHLVTRTLTGLGLGAAVALGALAAVTPAQAAEPVVSNAAAEGYWAYGGAYLGQAACEAMASHIENNLGIESECRGPYTGGVYHLYTWHEA